MNPAFEQFPENVRQLAAEVEAATGPITVERNRDLCVRRGSAAVTQCGTDGDGKQWMHIFYQETLTPEVAMHELLHLHREYVRRIPLCRWKNLIVRDSNGTDVPEMYMSGPLNLDNELEHFNIYREQAARGYPARDLEPLIWGGFANLGKITSALPRRLACLIGWANVMLFAPRLKEFAAGRLLEVGVEFNECRAYATLVQKHITNKLALVEITARAAGVPFANIEMAYFKRWDGVWKARAIPLDVARQDLVLRTGANPYA